MFPDSHSRWQKCKNKPGCTPSLIHAIPPNRWTPETEGGWVPLIIKHSHFGTEKGWLRHVSGNLILQTHFLWSTPCIQKAGSETEGGCYRSSCTNILERRKAAWDTLPVRLTLQTPFLWLMPSPKNAWSETDGCCRRSSSTNILERKKAD